MHILSGSRCISSDPRFLLTPFPTLPFEHSKWSAQPQSDQFAVSECAVGNERGSTLFFRGPCLVGEGADQRGCGLSVWLEWELKGA